MAKLPIHSYPSGEMKDFVGHAIIDDVILPLAQNLSWYMANGYAVAWINGASKPLHYFVWEHYKGPDSFPEDLQLDHLNQDKLDNRIENLVPVNDRVKQANAPKHCDNTSGFKGVKEQPNGRFMALVGRDYEQPYFGSYATAEEAAYAVNLGYAELHPEVPTPNAEVDAILPSKLKIAVEANVKRLRRPGRLPNEP